MSSEHWHSSFNPQKFLKRVNVDRFIEHNKAYNENKVDSLDRPCMFCGSLLGPGLLLNEGSYLCKTCFDHISSITYPEKYETLRRNYFRDKEALRLARDAFKKSCPYGKASVWAASIGGLSLLLLFFHWWLFFVPVLCFLGSHLADKKHNDRINEWNGHYPEPIEPELRHFHDPLAELSASDYRIIKVFNNWPGYPPFWNYLRDVVLDRDSNRCQVSGCPSRVSLHIHHKTPVSQGGEHVPSNLVTLCDFHHAIEPEMGHERIWGGIKTRYFTVVREHTRHNRASEGLHSVRAHVRRLELVLASELETIRQHYSLCCPGCDSDEITIEIAPHGRNVLIVCGSCRQRWSGQRALTEETGPRLAELLVVRRNEGRWKANWDVLATRADSLFSALRSAPHRSRSAKETIKSKTRRPAPECPKCGSPMKLIRPRPGQKWKPFWGCTKYSITGCKGSREADD